MPKKNLLQVGEICKFIHAKNDDIYKGYIIYGYRAHVLCSSMTMHYGAIMWYVIRFLNNAWKKSLAHHWAIVSQQES